MYKILFEQGDRHDATIYYVDIIKEALSSDNDVIVIDNIKDIEKEDLVVVVNAKACVRVLLKNRKQKVICWYQGIMPEEINVFYKGFTKCLRIILWSIFEIISLKMNVFSIFVSEKMRQHYQRKYRLKIENNYYIMPCFNQEIQKEYFGVEGKYDKPTFLYAGTLSEWQCIDKMLSLYQKIEKVLPDSILFLFTSEQEKAKALVSSLQLQHVIIKYVPFTSLNSEIKKCKYGFIIREDIEMNRVATPTKMNSYLANGIIPIYTGCIDSFRQNLSQLKYQILLNDDPVKQIVEFDAKKIDAMDVYKEYSSTVFSRYYSREFHINNLRSFINKMYSA